MYIAKQLSLLSMVALLAAGCSAGDESAGVQQPAEPPHAAGTPVVVVPVVGDGGTRAAMTTDATFAEFRMWGFQGTSDLTDGGAAFTKSATASTWSGDKTFYWIDGQTHQFFGVSPYGAVTGVSVSASAQSFDYTVPTANDAQQDLLVSSLLAQEKTADGTLSLPFRHALSTVLLKAKTTTDLAFDIHSITLCNIKNGGTFTFSPSVDCTETEGAAIGSWADNATTARASYGITLAADVTLTKAAAATITTLDGPQLILLRPQTVTKWDVTAATVTPATDPSQTGGYVAVECKIRTTGASPAYYGGSSASSYATVYFPLGFTMDMHKKYTLSLDFDKCRRADGSPVLSAVVVEPSLTATVSSWDSTAGETVITL